MEGGREESRRVREVEEEREGRREEEERGEGRRRNRAYERTRCMLAKSSAAT